MPGLKRILGPAVCTVGLFAGLISPVLAETVGTVEMEYTDPEHLHAPKIVDGVEYRYDANGNLVNDGERVISWNQDNLPVRIEKGGQVVEFFYDANGNRIVKKSGGTKTTYPSPYLTSHRFEESPLADQFNNETIYQKYYFANGRTAQSVNDTLTFLHQDHLGSTVLATDSKSQKLTEPLSYFPYGSFVNRFEESPLADNLTMEQFNNYLFTGQELDPESDLYNYNARLYNPTTGAFISADTVGGGNRYSYAANNPLLFTDPSGHMAAYDAGGGGGGEGGQTTNPDDVLQYEISGGGNTYQPPGITATTTINTTNTTSPSPDDWFLTEQEYWQWIAFMSDFGAITMGITTLVVSAPAFVAYLGFTKDYYYYNYAREPILRAKTVVQLLKPGNVVVRPAYTGELAVSKNPHPGASGAPGGKFIGHGRLRSGEIVYGEELWERYNTPNVVRPEHVHEMTHWDQFVAGGYRKVTNWPEYSWREIEAFESELTYLGNIGIPESNPAWYSGYLGTRETYVSGWEERITGYYNRGRGAFE